MKIETKESKGMKKSVAMKTFTLILGIIIMLTAAYIIVSPTTYKISPENFDKIYNSEDFLTVTEANNYTLNNKIISVKGEVIYIASPDLSGVRHERFVISDGNTSLVVIYNIDFLGRGFLNPEIGDRVVLVGELILGDQHYGNITAIGIIHKVAEGGFLLLYRHKTEELTEVGVYGTIDMIILSLASIISIAINFYTWYLSKKHRWHEIDLSQRRKRKKKR